MYINSSSIEIIKGEVLNYILVCDHDKSCIDQNGMENCNTENDNSISNNDEHQVMGILRQFVMNEKFDKNKHWHLL